LVIYIVVLIMNGHTNTKFNYISFIRIISYQDMVSADTAIVSPDT